jgi:hypothetical protein
VPSCSATVAAGTLAAMLTLRGRARLRPALLIGGWAALLLGGYAVAGRAGLGTLLTAAFALQVTPSIWTAYRTERPTGIARGTWLLVLCELSCWTIFGLHKPDPRLIVLGVSGVTASCLMLARVRRSARVRARYHLRERMPSQLREKRLAEALRTGRARRTRTHRWRRPRTPLNSAHHERERKAA